MLFAPSSFELSRLAASSGQPGGPAASPGQLRPGQRNIMQEQHAKSALEGAHMHAGSAYGYGMGLCPTFAGFVQNPHAQRQMLGSHVGTAHVLAAHPGFEATHLRLQATHLGLAAAQPQAPPHASQHALGMDLSAHAMAGGQPSGQPTAQGLIPARSLSRRVMAEGQPVRTALGADLETPRTLAPEGPAPEQVGVITLRASRSRSPPTYVEESQVLAEAEPGTGPQALQHQGEVPHAGGCLGQHYEYICGFVLQ